MLLMIWASVALTTFLEPLFTNASYNPGGDHGLYISSFIGNLVGAPGLTALLILVAVAFLTYFSAATVIFIRKLLNPAIYYNKVKFTVNKGAEQTDTNEYEDEEAETLVFDDPAKQEVIFDDNGGAVVIDEGYQNEDINIKEGPMPKPVKPEPKQPEASGSEIEMVVEE